MCVDNTKYLMKRRRHVSGIHTRLRYVSFNSPGFKMEVTLLATISIVSMTTPTSSLPLSPSCQFLFLFPYLLFPLFVSLMSLYHSISAYLCLVPLYNHPDCLAALPGSIFLCNSFSLCPSLSVNLFSISLSLSLSLSVNKTTSGVFLE